MITFENVAILIVFGLALGYIIRNLYQQFSSPSACASGCSKCSVDFEKVVDTKKIIKKNAN